LKQELGEYKRTLEYHEKHFCDAESQKREEDVQELKAQLDELRVSLHDSNVQNKEDLQYHKKHFCDAESQRRKKDVEELKEQLSNLKNSQRVIKFQNKDLEEAVRKLQEDDLQKQSRKFQRMLAKNQMPSIEEVPRREKSRSYTGSMLHETEARVDGSFASASTPSTCAPSGQATPSDLSSQNSWESHFVDLNPAFTKLYDIQSQRTSMRRRSPRPRGDMPASSGRGTPSDSSSWHENLSRPIPSSSFPELFSDDGTISLPDSLPHSTSRDSDDIKIPTMNFIGMPRASRSSSFDGTLSLPDSLEHSTSRDSDDIKIPTMNFIGMPRENTGASEDESPSNLLHTNAQTDPQLSDDNDLQNA